MPIPEFAAGGLLPRGIHDCTMDEVRQRFGTFQSSERRPRLFAALQTFADEVRKARIFEALLINGSFVTTWPDPNDIDLILVLRETHDFKQDLRPQQYGLVQANVVRKRWGFDIVVAKVGSAAYVAAVDLFQQVKHEPGAEKGILRIAL
jgi:hypothetical protein